MDEHLLCRPFPASRSQNDRPGLILLYTLSVDRCYPEVFLFLADIRNKGLYFILYVQFVEFIFEPFHIFWS